MESLTASIVFGVFAVAIIILQVWLIALMRRRTSGREIEELTRISSQVTDMERRLSEAFLRETGDIREKVTKALGESQTETTQIVRQNLDGLSETLTRTFNDARKEIAGTDKNIQDKFDGLGKQVQSTISQTVTSIDKRMATTTESLDNRMKEVNAVIDARLATSQQSIDELQKRLAELKSASDQMLNVGVDIRKLRDILAAPKLRGGFGELLLENMLKDLLPSDRWKAQYQLPDGGLVDAIIRLPDGIVPVDSKFPMESFVKLQEAEDESARETAARQLARDIKGHIDKVAGYIRPQSGTFDFALMYIPAENVYYELLTNETIAGGDSGVLAHAREKRVIPVSPQVLYAYIQTLLLGLKGLKVHENARKIIDGLSALRAALGRVDESYGKASNQLRHASSNFEDVRRELDRLENVLATLESISEDDEGSSE
ncbi:DNA recombination protein RmuC [bacterium]|nr:DNA recombination protein RmuC [bacterium]